MDLVPITHGDLASGTVTVDEVRRQKIGVKTDVVKRAPFVVIVRTVGRIGYDETRLHDVTLKVPGFIRKLSANATGEPIKKGEVLFTLYSPEVLAAQHELLAAHQTGSSESLVRATQQRLRLWDISPGDIDAVLKRGTPLEALPIRSPASGFLIEKNVVEGAAVEPGMKLFRIAALDRVWVEAEVFEADLPSIKAGMPAAVRVPSLRDRAIQGKISFVAPYLTGQTRTAQVRIEVDNSDLQLRPEMSVDVEFKLDRGERLQVPSSAVIYTGPRRLVFVDLGDGRLQPREVQLGSRSHDAWEVSSGLSEGERVVTSGNFLIAAESRLRSAAEYWTGETPSKSKDATPAPSPAGSHEGH
jgi:membrane fusion protein, copper/silver efflux system